MKLNNNNQTNKQQKNNQYLFQLSHSQQVFFICTILLCSLVTPICSQDFTVSSSSSLINVNCDLHLIIPGYAIASDIPNGSKIILSFPKQYNATAFTSRSFTGYDPVWDFCINLDSNCANVTITSKGLSLIIDNIFKQTFPSSQTLNIQYTIFNVPNPPFIGSAIDYFITIVDSSFVVQYTLYTSVVSTFTAPGLACTYQVMQPLIWTISPLKLAITPNTLVDFFIFTFPASWVGEGILSNAKTSILTCSSSNFPSTACPFPKVTNINYVTIGSNFDLTIYSIYNPTSKMNTGQITIDSYYQNKFQQKCILTLADTSFSTDMLRQTKISHTYLSNDQIQIVITFEDKRDKTAVFLSSDNFSIIFPPDFIVPPSSSSFTAIDTLSGDAANSFTVIPANNEVKFQPYLNAVISILSISIKFTATGITRPRQCKTSGNFTINTYRSGTQQIDSNTCCSIKLLNRQTLAASSILLSDFARIASGVTYTFSFSTSVVYLITTDSIRIQFPSQYSSQITAANSATICSALILTVSGSIKTRTCSVDLNMVTISSFLGSNSVGTDTIKIQIGGLTNPSSTPAVGFTFTTLSNNGYVLQQKTGVSATITGSLISTFTVNSNSLVTCASDSIYTFTISNNGPLSNGYLIQITFSVDIYYINYNTLQCKLNTIIMPCYRLGSTYNTNTHIIEVQVNAAVATITSLSISSITNPYSYAPTATFAVAIIDKTGLVIESNANPATITMNIAGSFLNFIATSNAYSSSNMQPSIALINQQLTSIYIYMVVPYNLANDSSILLTFSNSSYVSNTSISNCSSFQFVSNCSFDVNSSTFNLQVTITSANFSIGTSNWLEIQLTNLIVHNYQQIQLTAILKVAGFMSLSLFPSVSFSAMFIQKVSAYSVSFDSTQLGQPVSVNMNILLSANTSLFLSYFKIFIPKQFTASAYTVTVPLSNFTNNSLILTGLTNPTTISNNPFLFTAFDVYNSPIAFSSPSNTSNLYSFKLTCPLYCKSCNGSLCTSCYSGISWIFQIYLQISTNSCVKNCSQFEYLSGTTCLPCDSNCSTCKMYGSNFTNGSASVCLTCQSPKLLLNGICYLICPIGYYSNSPICAPCMTNCLDCTNYSSCSSCQSGYSLYINQCIPTCYNTTVAFLNVSTGQSFCFNCPNGCLSCSSAAIPQCLICISGFYLYNGVCYNNSCPLSLLPYWSGVCSSCQCLSCSIYSFNCTSCLFPLQLYNFQCLSLCPSGTYSAVTICLPCSIPFCSVCSTASYCQLCPLPYALSITNSSVSSCVLVCPNGTIKTIDTTTFKYQCQACSLNCLTCSISLTFCLACYPGKYLHNSTCVSSCPSPLWLINGSCLSCVPQCQKCLPSNSSSCSLCVSNYYLYQSTCLATCPNGTYPDILLSNCSACSSLCLTCQNSVSCSSCIGGYYLYNSLCYNNCVSMNPLFYSYNGSCLLCQSKCSSCLATPYECSSCSSSLYYYNAVTLDCTLNCSFPYFANSVNLTCIICQYPCLVCDTTFNSCLSCNTTIQNLTLFNGVCYSSCPSGYYTLNAICIQCPNNCSTCDATRCLTCLPYAYIYYTACVLNCSQFPDQPITINNYCTNCASVPYCQQCSAGASMNFVCFLCVYPYVIFQGNCLNKCPNLYVADNSTNKCIQSPSYSQQMQNIYNFNKPKFPPFLFAGILILAGVLVSFLSLKQYIYTYYYGFLIALESVVETFFLLYGIIYILTRYEGDYTLSNKYMPLYLLGISYLYKLVVMNVLFFLRVIVKEYLNDARYKEWFYQNKVNSVIMIILTIVFGPRINKLYYSKLFGKNIFAYRVVSVQKFYYEDLINWFVCLSDLLDIAAFIMVAYNIFILYSVLYLYTYQLILLKMIVWCLLLYDLKKPDRGFFSGDQEEAERQIQLQEAEREAQKRKFQMESLVKLIRRKSAALLIQEKLYEHLYIEDFKSVYDPSDYEDVIKVPNRRIQKNINRGKFRKGKRITIEQKLKRFAESIKPAPIVVKDNGFMNGLIYWKPPRQLKIQQKRTIPQQSQDSMMKILQDKQIYYKDDLDNIDIEDMDRQSGIDHDHHFRRRKRNDSTFMVEGDDTLIYDTSDHFYDPSSLELIEPEEEYDFNGLMNRNYAKKKHLPQKLVSNKYDEQQLRILNHRPQKKRQNRSKLNQISIRRF